MKLRVTEQNGEVLQTEKGPVSPAAAVSFVLGLASLVFLAVAGVPALIVGLRGLRAINASDGKLRGARLAVAGLALGGLGTIATGVCLAVLIMLHLGEKSKRVDCANHLRQIGMGINKYAENNNDQFPRGTIPNADLPPEQRLSWMVSILPLVGETNRAQKQFEDLATKIDRTQAWDSPANRVVSRTNVRVFLCAGHPHFEPNRPPALAHYVGLAGIDPDAATLATAHPRAGVFGYERIVTRKDVVGGISFTLMATETAHENGPWLAGGPATVRGVDPKEPHLFGPGRAFGGLHHGGLNVLAVDGSVRWLSDSVPPRLFRVQTTLADREPDEK
jgi:hypothetical protein